MSPLAALSSTEIGERLRVARDDAGLTQADAAQTLGMARTTLVAMEQGQRPAKIDEVQKLARLYAPRSMRCCATKRCLSIWRRNSAR